MTQQLIVSVDAPEDRPDQMTVQDVFSHVIDLFQLVNQSDPGSESVVRWRLVSVSMNSPMTVIAEAMPVYAGMVIEEAAKQQKRAFVRNYSELKAGRLAPAWTTTKARETAERFISRNRNGIGKTTIDARVEPADTPITITKDDAAVVDSALAVQPRPAVRTKAQIGSIEGDLIQVHTYYGQPAIQLRERKSKEEIWCIVPAQFQHEISLSTSVEDVWKGRRVVVRGKILYGTDGSIARVVASAVRLVEVKDVPESALADRDFTSGLPIAEYLERFRDGSLDS